MLEAYRNMGKRLTVVVYGVSDVVLEVLKGAHASVGCLAAEAKEGNHGQPAQGTHIHQCPASSPEFKVCACECIAGGRRLPVAALHTHTCGNLCLATHYC